MQWAYLSGYLLLLDLSLEVHGWHMWFLPYMKDSLQFCPKDQKIMGQYSDELTGTVLD